MEFVLKSQELEPFPASSLEYVKSEGFLNSNYQNVVNETLSNSSSDRIFGIRQSVKRKHFQLVTPIETILKVAVFLIVLTIIF
jgi:hypothetical protein